MMKFARILLTGMSLLFILVSFHNGMSMSGYSGPEPKNRIPSLFFRNQGTENNIYPYRLKSMSTEAFIGKGQVLYSVPVPVTPTDSAERGSDAALQWIQLHYIGFNEACSFSEERPAAAHANFLTGNDPSEWKTQVPLFNTLICKDLYPGIDLVYDAENPGFKNDYRVHPGADPSSIRIRYEGASSLTINSSGALIITLQDGTVCTEHIPRAYQGCGTTEKEITAGYIIYPDLSVGFSLGPYDRNTDLVIDPVLIFSTYMGGFDDDRYFTTSICRDSNGYLYNCGRTASVNFPVTPGSYDQTYNGPQYDCFVLKMSPDGDSLIWCTFVGGSGYDVPVDIEMCIPNGEVAVIAGTGSVNFPVTPGAYQNVNHLGSLDAVLFKLNAAGDALLFSTFIGGTNDDIPFSLCMGPDGNFVFSGQSKGSFPVTTGAYQTSQGNASGGTYDIFVGKMNSTGTNLIWATYLGGSGEDKGGSVITDELGFVYVNGMVNNGYPVTAGAYDGTYNGGTYDVGISKLSPDGTTLVYSTFLGSTGEDMPRKGFVVNSSHEVTLTGLCATGFPTTPGVYDQTYNGGTADMFLTRLNSNGNGLVFSTFLGTTGYEEGKDLFVRPDGSIVLTGFSGTGFPTTSCAYDKTYNGGAYDATLTLFSSNAGSILYSTYIGGSGDDKGQAVIIDGDSLILFGETSSSNFPTTAGAFNVTYNGGSYDAFALKIFAPPPSIADFTTNTPLCLGDTSWFTNSSTGCNTYVWNFGDGVTSTNFQPYHVYQQAGTFSVRLIGTGDCTADTAFQTVLINQYPAGIGEPQYLDLGPMVSYYPMDHDINDYSGHNLNGTVNGPYRTESLCNPLDSCFQFDGIPNHISLPTSTLYNTPAKSISFWFRKNNDSIMITPGPMAEVEGLVFKNNNTGTGVQFNMELFGQYPPFSLVVQSGNGSALTSIVSPPMILPHIWYHATGIITTSMMYLYVDGTFIDSLAIAGLTTNNFPVLLGKIAFNGESTRYFVGNMEDLRIYNRVLNACEVKYLASACQPPKTLSVSLSEDTICTGNTVCVNLINPEYHIEYQLLNALTMNPVGPAVLASCDSVLCLPSGAVDSTLQLLIRAHRPQTACSILLDTTLTIHVNDQYINNLSFQICPGDSIFALGQYLHDPGFYTDTIATPGECDSVVNVNIQNFPPFSIDLGADTNLCTGQSLVLDPGNGFADYQWNTGAFSPTLAVNQTNLYSVTVTDGNGCSDADSIQVTFSPSTVYVIDTLLCEGQSYFAAGSWQNTPGTYYDTISLASGCDSVRISQLTFYAKYNQLFGADTSYCAGQAFTLLPSGNFNSFIWQDGTTNPSLTIQQGGTYSVTVTDSDGCVGYDTILITELPTFTSQNPASICQGDSLWAGGGYQTLPGTYYDTLTGINACDSVIITLLTMNPVYQLYLNAQICDGDSVLLGGQYQYQSGVYYDHLLTVKACDSTLVTQLQVIDSLQVDLGPDSYICEGDQVTIGIPDTSMHCLWPDGSTFNQFMVDQPGWYWVEVTREGCKSHDSIFFDTCSLIWFPNVFTPNGDHTNDFFLPRGQEILEYELLIYNRWGQLLFTSRTLEEGWDGRFKGTDCASGVYVFIAKYRGKGPTYDRKHMTTGAVTLLR